MSNYNQIQVILFSGLLILFVSSCNNKQDANTNEQIKQNKVIDTKNLAKKANLFYEQNDCQKAIACYDSLVLIDSTKGGYYFKRGFCKSMLLDVISAIADYKTAIARNYSEKASAYLNIGVLYRVSLNKPDSAIFYYNECLKIEPDNEKATREKSLTSTPPSIPFRIL